MSGRTTVALLGLLALGAPRTALSWEVGTAATTPCHEEMTLAAALPRDPQEGLFGSLPTALPKDERWQGLYRQFASRLGLKETNTASRWELTSLLVGLRYPDLGSGSAASVNDLQKRHEDVTDNAAHFIRGPTDDYQAGDASAVAAGAMFVRQGILEAWSAMHGPSQILRKGVYLDDYGTVTLELWAPAFLLGVALHSFEDSFSHCLRSDDLRRIRHVMNAIEAGNRDFSPRRDGLPHSFGMDECDGAGAPIAAVVPTAVADLLDAVRHVDNEVGLNVALTRWLAYEAGCDLDNDFCDSRWLDIARSDPLVPPFSCAVPHPTGARATLLGILLVSAGLRL